jgi:hypothetical protein
MAARITLYVIAALLLGAHFLRAGSLLPMLVCAAAPLLFFYKRRLSLYLLQAGAYFGTATWLFAAWRLIELRQQFGRPWTAAAAILGAVALVTLVSGLLLNSRPMRDRYQ